MQKITANDPETQSADLVGENLEKLKALFPEAFKEGKVDFEVLKQLLGGAVDEREERYGLNWHGKRLARQMALTPSLGTLRPCPEESVDWDTTQNLMIEGDNLEVLKLLQKSYAGKVKLIYIDPPYNTGKDFVYPDNFKDSIKNYHEITGDGSKVRSNPETSGRYHTDWLNMMYPRLKVARTLLDDTGVICVSIDDSEVDRLKVACADVFGEENFLAVMIWNKQHSQQQGIFKRYHEYILVFAKDASAMGAIAGGDGEIDAGALKKVSRANPASEFEFPAGTRFDAADGTELRGTYGDAEKVSVVRGRMRCKSGRLAEPVTLSAGWTQKNQMLSWFSGSETFDTREQKVLEFYFNGAGKLKCRKERGRITPPTLLPEYGMVSEQTASLDALMGAHVFSNPKPVPMISDFVSWFTAKDDVIVDFFAGSGTSAESVWRRNLQDGGDRRIVLVQLPELLDSDNQDQAESARFCASEGVPANIAELTKERLRRAGARIRSENPLFKGDTGFRVFKLDSSNIRTWDPNRDALAESLFDHTEHLVPGRTEQDVVFELLLKLGLDLTVPIVTRTLAGKAVHSIGDGALIISLADGLDRATVDELARGILAWRAELAPAVSTSFVFKDSGFTDDVAKSNLVETLRQGLDPAVIDTIRSI